MTATSNTRAHIGGEEATRALAVIALCGCGCGNPTPIATKTRGQRGEVKGVPKPFLPRHRERLEVAERFWSKVSKTSGCWLWTAARDVNGYGQFRLSGQMRGQAPAAINARKDSCPTGHLYSTENTRIKVGGGRQCRACEKARSKTRPLVDCPECGARLQSKHRAAHVRRFHGEAA